MRGKRVVNDFTPNYLGVSSEQFLRMTNGAKQALTVQLGLAEAGKSIVSELLATKEEHFSEWDHLPKPDIYDESTGFQYYYHAHAASEREENEHGHFHVFVNLKKRLPEVVRKDYGDKKRCLAHLLAISVDGQGIPLRLFTTNEWVSDDQFVPATTLLPFVEQFEITDDSRLPEVTAWVNGVMATVLLQARYLIEQRDLQLRNWANGALQEVLQNKEYEIPSSLPFNLFSHAQEIEKASLAA